MTAVEAGAAGAAAEHARLWTIDIAQHDPQVPHPRLWHHFQCDLPTAQRELDQLHIAPEVSEALTTIETRPRAMPLAGGTLLILRSINRNPGSDPEDMIAVRIWFDATTVVTTRRRTRPLESLVELKRLYERDRGPVSPTEFVCTLIAHIVDRIGEFVDDIDERLSALEGTESSARMSMQPGELRRDTAAVRRYLAPQRDALDTLSRLHDTFSQDQLNAIADEIDRSTRYLEDLELARERAVLLQEELRSELARQQNVRMYALSLVTAIFLPLSFLTGLFGMNVAGLPGTEDPASFLRLVGAMTGIAGVCALLFRWIRWF